MARKVTNEPQELWYARRWALAREILDEVVCDLSKFNEKTEFLIGNSLKHGHV